MNNNLKNIIIEKESNICQIVINKDNKIIYNESFNNYKQNDNVHIMSVTKSIVSLLIGICIDLGLIKSLDDKILDYFPDYKVKKGEKNIYNVTIRNLMTMTAPFKCKGDPWTKVCTTNDWTKASLDLLGGRKFNKEFKYMTVTIHILTGIISKVSGLTSCEFINKYLFEPLNINPITPYLAETAEEHKQFTISKTPKNHIWFTDPKEICTTGYGLCLSALDLNKIGQLVLKEGKYNNKQIISSEYINNLFKITNKLDNKFNNMSYGMLWWIIDEKNKIYAAIGNSGNVIYINKTKNLVVSITSYFKPTVFDRIDFIQKYIDEVL